MYSPSHTADTELSSISSVAIFSRPLLVKRDWVAAMSSLSASDASFKLRPGGDPIFETFEAGEVCLDPPNEWLGWLRFILPHGVDGPRSAPYSNIVAHPVPQRLIFSFHLVLSSFTV